MKKEPLPAVTAGVACPRMPSDTAVGEGTPTAVGDLPPPRVSQWLHCCYQGRGLGNPSSWGYPVHKSTLSSLLGLFLPKANNSNSHAGTTNSVITHIAKRPLESEGHSPFLWRLTCSLGSPWEPASAGGPGLGVVSRMT